MTPPLSPTKKKLHTAKITGYTIIKNHYIKNFIVKPENVVE